ncbi:AbrB/MazE/SpoVT family DNA-binding domain-containing protein [Phormidesmis priestleyi ULC007]|uniref:AbrB/MazE/SpoVT family DNA-binding domain-containing protein n=1 Tax=Phormidesmis priestleyi ULC007 TaxID=1920490 RepID=A0A2T1DLD0_9CYAN|nr:AbrB/MazE/SpoVT family DNA-binding domain-containing protein [Phormidesmis priestleyi]PSB21261.1 AbrB/MazE/SpoVT family DNA-binding domain-containing protein [Phormidesmis priestleyi ULC007]PZO50632.1 MAG: AbrB/MazE/SpoVT family DNA-binding domain-containing protein [Phormidesmis priestleyi]
MKPQVVAKWGNSLGVRIPMQIAKQINLQEGTNITFTVVNGSLIIKPEKKQYTLDDLLVGMNLDNVHAEVEMGQPVGNEIW